MKNLGSLQKAAAVATVALLLQLCATANAGNASRFTLSMKGTGKSTAVHTGPRLEINRHTCSSSTKTIPVILSALTPKIGEIDSIIADGRTDRTRVNGGEGFSKKWDRSDEFRLKFSVDRYWADQFHNEFRRSWIDSERRRGPSPFEIYGR